MTKAIGNFPYILIFSRLRNRFSLKPITYINFIKHCYKCTSLTPLIKVGTIKLLVANI